MAYVKKEDLVVFNLGDKGQITALVTDIQFRRFRKSWKDKKTGESKSRFKSVPYAICKITSSTIDQYSVAERFIIAGYKLKNHAMHGEKCLMLNNQYIADFEQHGRDWVAQMLKESDTSREKKEAING